jgi:predicted ester cyclase
MSPHSLWDFAASYTEAWCSRDPDRVLEFFSEDGSLRVNDADPAAGRAAIRGVVVSFMDAFPDLHLTMDELELQATHPIYRWTLTGTNDGPGGAGRKVEISGHEVWTIGDDGLIAESRGHFDAADYARQLQGTDGS